MEAKNRFNQQADAFLAKFYNDYGAVTKKQKINLLELKLGGPSNFYAMGHEVTDDMKIGAYEYELLDSHGLIEMTLV